MNRFLQDPMAPGLALVLLAVIYLFNIARRKGEPFEYAGALFIGEAGLAATVGLFFESEILDVTVTAVFFAAMLVTAVMWLKLFRQYERRPQK